MLTLKRTLLFLLFAAFAPELVAAARWGLSELIGAGAHSALQGLALSAIALAASAALICAALRLLRTHGLARGVARARRRSCGR